METAGRKGVEGLQPHVHPAAMGPFESFPWMTLSGVGMHLVSPSPLWHSSAITLEVKLSPSQHLCSPHGDVQQHKVAQLPPLGFQAVLLHHILAEDNSGSR